MSQSNASNVVPFKLPAYRLRQHAADYRRRRQPLTALEMQRQAMEQQDTTAIRLELCETLISMSNYDQATDLLCRTISRNDVPPKIWLLLAQCMEVLGNRVELEDCLYHYLLLDSESDTADHVRDSLSSLHSQNGPYERARLAGLIRRGVSHWKDGDRALAYRRLHRAIRISLHPAEEQLNVAMLYLSESNRKAACAMLAQVLRQEPAHPWALASLCLALHNQGYKRVALGMLEKCARACDRPGTYHIFLSTALTMKAFGPMQRYLEEHIRRNPCNKKLLQVQASLLAESNPQRARQLWHRILRIDPTDQHARINLRLLDQRRKPIPQWEDLPEMTLLSLALDMLPALEQPNPLAPGSQARLIADWAFSQHLANLQASVFRALTLSPVSGLEDYLRELLPLPWVSSDIRQEARTYLEQHGVTESMPIRAGSHIIMTQEDRVQHSPRRYFSNFLTVLLLETRHRRQAMPLAFYAAGVWPYLSPKIKAKCGCYRCYPYVKAVEIRYLLDTCQEEALQSVHIDPVYRRKVNRVLHMLGRLCPPTKGE